MNSQDSKNEPAMATEETPTSQESLGEKEDSKIVDDVDLDQVIDDEDLDQIIDDMDLDEILEDENLAEAAAHGAGIQALEDADSLAEIRADLAAAQEEEEAEYGDVAEIDVPDTPADDARTIKDDMEEILGHVGVDYSTARPWTDHFIGLCHGLKNGDLEKQLRAFLADIKVDERAASSVDIYRFLHSDKMDWDTHDEELDKAWEKLVARIAELSNGEIRREHLSKPSGPLDAVLACVWRYPTWNSDKIWWGHAMDKSNNCMKAQDRRIGANLHARTHNRIPVRHAYKNTGIKWEESYTNWRNIDAELLRFSQLLNKRSKIILAIGKENAKSVHDLLDLGNPLEATLEAIKVKIHVEFHVLGEQSYFHIIRNKATKEIKHVVLYTAHSQHFFYERVGLQTRAYHDFIWNVACEFTHIPVLRPTYYLRQKETHVHRLSVEQIRKYGLTQFDLARRLRAGEKRSGVLLPKMAVETAFRRTFTKNPTFVLDADINGSYVGAVLRLFIKHGREARTEEWRKSEPGQRWVKSLINAWKNRGARGKENKWTTEEYKNSASAQNTLDALKKGRTKTQISATTKIDALMRVKQVQDRLNADLSSLTADEVYTRERIQGLRDDEPLRRRRWLTFHVVFYSDDYPNGLRYAGDGGGPDNFPYGEMDHPAVRLENGWTTTRKREFALNAGR